MRKSLGAAPANIEILATSKFPVPPGELVFPRESLTEPATGDAAVWNGYVAFDTGRFPVWARLRLTTLQSRLVSVVGLGPGHVIAPSDLKVESVDEFPRRLVPLTTIEAAVGQVARRAIPAATILTASMLEVPNDIERGQTVMVAVRSGGAILKIEAKAESAGHRGEMVSLRNPISGLLFRAEIEGKGRALLKCAAESEDPQ
jgi:flagella basal body P-ring formation protein FlgA